MHLNSTRMPLATQLLMDEVSACCILGTLAAEAFWVWWLFL